MNKNRTRSTLVLSALCILLAAVCLTGCTKKRCLCTTTRVNHQPTRGLEELGDHKNCSEFDKEWVASDSTGDLLVKTCVPEPEQ